MTMPFRPRWYFFVALVSITFIGPLSIHLFIPAMPAVKEAFGVSTGVAQLTLSLGMLSMAFFTVAYGGLSDRFGRKRVLLGGLVLFTCGAPAAWPPPICRCCWRGAYCRERERAAASCWRALSPATSTARTALRK